MSANLPGGRWNRVALAGAGLLALLGGCSPSGPPTYPVRGVVMLDGEPVPTGTVMFIPELGPPATATIGAQGDYALQAVAGRHTVTIIAQQRLPADFDPMNLPPDWVPPPSLVPVKYNRPATSGLVVDVAPTATNKADLQLEN